MVDGTVLGLSLWFCTELIGQFYQWESDDMKPWVEWFRTHWIRWPVKGILAIIGGHVGVYWYESVARPHIQQGPIGWLILLFLLFVSFGLAVSLARHTMTDYSMVDMRRE